MLSVILVVLMLIIFGALFIYAFFYINAIEKRLADVLEHVEIHLLNEYGEINARMLQEESLEDDGDKG
jgi:hypothetical protein